MDGIKLLKSQIEDKPAIEKLNAPKGGGAHSGKGIKTAEEAAQDFEGLLLKQMLSEMWQTIPKEGVLEGGRAEEMYYDMFHESVADSIAKNGGIGIKDELLEDMKRQEKKGR